MLQCPCDRVFWHCVKRPATPHAVLRTGVTCLAAANGINTCCSTTLPTLPKNQLTTKAYHQQSTSPHSTVWVHTLWQTSSLRYVLRRRGGAFGGREFGAREVHASSRRADEPLHLACVRRHLRHTHGRHLSSLDSSTTGHWRTQPDPVPTPGRLREEIGVAHHAFLKR